MTMCTCPVCSYLGRPCVLCLSDPETAHELANEMEGDRIALEFAETGQVAGLLAWKTLPLNCDVHDFDLVE